MNSAPHRIRSLRWQVDAGSAAEAFSWRTLLREKGTALLLPALEQGFDEAAAGEQIIHIPKIELKVRLNSEGELETILPGRIIDQLREQLPRLMADDGAGLQTHAAINTAAKRSRLEILLQYLQTGTLPWQATGITASNQADVLTKTCREQLTQIVVHLKSAREDAPFYFRLLQLLLEEECILLIRAFSVTIPQESGAAPMRCLELLLDEGPERFCRCTRLKLAAAILAESAAWREGPSAGTLAAAADAAVPPQERYLLNRFVAELPRHVSDLFQQRDPDTAAGRSGFTPDAETAENLTGDTSDKGYQFRTEETSAELFPLLVQQAGLVLLHPYIVRFFESCGVKEAGGAELNFSDLPRAAALLHFLATGREELYEYELGLVKILLGLHPETALPVCDGLLTTDDMEEAETLLQSVVGHWSALKNTSVDGIRSTFIERQGLLREEESGWKLNVERRPYDMLLDRIPWGISIVKLPWMYKAIFTEW